ncbi:MAG: hypothetical protein WC477_05285 [Patescibacteria group bacterium]
MNKKTIVTPSMKCEYSEKIVLQLYMQKLITQDEYKTILIRLREHYKITRDESKSNGISPN